MEWQQSGLVGMPQEAQNISQPKKKVDRDFVKWVNFYLTGSFLKQTSHLAYLPRILYSSILLICGVCGAFMVYLKYDDLSLNTDVLIHFICEWHTLFVYLVFLKNRTKLCRLTQTMQNRFTEISDKLHLDKYHACWDKSDRLTLTVVRPAAYLCVTVYTFYFLNANPFSTNRRLVFPMWVPFSLDSDIRYFSTIALQLSIFWIYFFTHICGNGVGMGGSYFIGASFDVLGCAFQDICNGKAESKHLTGDKPRLKNTSDIPITQLKLWVETHLAVLRLIKDYKAVYEAILLEALLSCEIVICFGGFQAVLAAEAWDFTRGIILSTFVFLMSFHLFFFCYKGQHIYNKSELLRETLYTSNWEDQSLEFQKSFLFIMRFTVKPVTVTYKGIMDASMSSYMHAMRTAFSYVNILLVLREVK